MLKVWKTAVLSVALATGSACADSAWSAQQQPASAGVERRSDEQLQASAARAARTVQLLQWVTAFDVYQSRAGQLGLTLGQNFSVKRLAIALRDDHNRLTGSLKAAMSEAAMPVGPAIILPPDLSARLSALFQLDQQDFDGVFVASEIKTDQQALDQLGVFKAGDLDPAARATLQLLTDTLQRRLDQAQTLQRQLG